MKLYSAEALRDQRIEPPQMVVDGLLPVGLTVLAGAPKLGKSWLVLELCSAVACQEPFLGRQTFEGGVLYADLEGGQYRLQERLAAIGCGYPKYLQITHEVPRLGEGLLEDLDQWWSCSDTMPKLIVLDTVGRIKGQGERGLNAYESDSRMFGQLQKFALEKKLAILCVTHLRKQNSYSGADPDWLERISGSMGLSGCADCVWGLFRSRGSDTAYLRTSARDVNAGDMVLRFDNGIWRFVSDDVTGHEFRQAPLVQFLEDLQAPYSGSAADLCEKYQAFCKEHSLPQGLSDGQPVASFGKQMKNMAKEAWRIRKSITADHTKSGTRYLISAF